MWLGGISCQNVWGMIFQWGSTLKVSTELPTTTRHRRDMTERLLKATLSPNQTNKQVKVCLLAYAKCADSYHPAHAHCLTRTCKSIQSCCKSIHVYNEQTAAICRSTWVFHIRTRLEWRGSTAHFPQHPYYIWRSVVQLWHPLHKWGESNTFKVT